MDFSEFLEEGTDLDSLPQGSTETQRSMYTHVHDQDKERQIKRRKV